MKKFANRRIKRMKKFYVLVTVPFLTLVCISILVYHLSFKQVLFSKKAPMINIEDFDRRSCNGTVYPGMRKSNESTSNFFIPSKVKVTQTDFNWILVADNVCKSIGNPFLLIMVQSTAVNVRTRQAIRNTWGSVATSQKWVSDKKMNISTQLVFVFGVQKTSYENKILKAENEFYGDVVQSDFKDSYLNLTYKTITSLKWMSEFCSSAKYVLKTDDDIFLHTPNLIKVINYVGERTCGYVLGYASWLPEVLRSGKWSVPLETYSLKLYPPYAMGHSYVISGKLINMAIALSEYYPFVNNEDVFLTGIIRKALGAELFHNEYFATYKDRRTEPCSFNNDFRVSSHFITPERMYEIWDAMERNLDNCYT